MVLFSFLNSLHTIFHKKYTSLQPIAAQRFFFLPARVTFPHNKDDGDLLDSISPGDCSIEHLFRHLLAIQMSPLRKCLHEAFVLFLIRLFLLLFGCWVYRVPYVFWELIPYQMWSLDVVYTCFESDLERMTNYDQQNNNTTRKVGLYQPKQCLYSTGNDQW